MADARQEQAAQGAVQEADQFAALLQKEFKPKTDRARAEVENAVRTLAEQALRETTVVSDDVIGTIKAIIAEIDKKLSDQVNAIMHQERFQQVESAWRGLHHLVSNSETDEMLKIRVMNISKKDLAKTLKKYKGTAWDQSPLFKKLYEQEYGQLGGEPYGCLVGDYYFDHTPGDVELLGQMAQIAAAAHAPFIAAASPTVMGMDTWQELANPRDVGKIFSSPEYAGWRSLRESDDAKYIGLAMPRFLARVPYGASTSPVEEFDFEEETSGGDHTKYTWANAAYAMAVNVNRAFKQYGWCTAIRGVESGGAVEGLPVHTFPSDDGGVDMKCPTEIAISDRREAELANSGFMPLIHRKNTDVAAFIGAQCRSRRNTPTRTRRPTRGCRRACRTCSRAAASRTTSSAWFATRWARSRNGPTWSGSCRTGSRTTCSATPAARATSSRRASRWRAPRSRCPRSRATRVTTPRASTCGLTTSSRA